MLDHEGIFLLPMNPQRLDRGRTGANEISHSFLTLVGNPDRRELAGLNSRAAQARLDSSS